MKIMLLIISLCLLSSCVLLETVKPWQRDYLAHEQMQLDADPLMNQVDDKIYFSREAATGGRSIGGGGCGCN